MTPPDNSERVPAVSAAPTWRTTLVPRWRDASTDLTRLPLKAVDSGVTLPFIAVRLSQTTCSAVDLAWMRNAEARAKQWINSRNPPPGFRVEAARSGGKCEVPLDLGSI
jgi:hypothetical protein